MGIARGARLRTAIQGSIVVPSLLVSDGGRTGLDAITWLLRDEFTDTRAAGAVNGTPATPGPGTRTVVDTDGDGIRDRGEYLATHEVHAFLERTVDGVTTGGWVLIEGPVASDKAAPPPKAYEISSSTEASLADYGLSGQCTGLLLEDPDPAGSYPPFLLRRTVAHVRSEKLELSSTRPIRANSKRHDGEAYVSEGSKGGKKLSIQGVVPGLSIGQVVALRGKRTDPDHEGVWETVVLTLDEEPLYDTNRLSTLLTFSEELEASYDRETITVKANVVPATHGETVSETLGSGSGATANQTFRLAKPPLTHISAETASGAESTLEIRVDGVLWDEADCLYGLSDDSRSYVVRIDNDAAAHVTFGDGVEGARLPTGTENVTAAYRSGIGLAGELDADRLTLLKTRPLGVREVTNPVSASGADDPESLADARANAPLRVLTLDRVVSLQDNEDFTRAYMGIGKAQATVIWEGTREIVHLTVASASGEGIADTTRDNLPASLDAARDPREQVIIEDFEPLQFVVAARLRIDPAYLWETVKEDVEEAVASAFAFDQRAFGQPVTAAELVSTMHQVDGVIAVDLEDLRLFDGCSPASGTPLDWVLAAEKARYDRDEDLLFPAQLLLLAPSGIDLTEMPS